MLEGLGTSPIQYPVSRNRRLNRNDIIAPGHNRNRDLALSSGSRSDSGYKKVSKMGLIHYF
jgi:hypothetical protein